MAEMLPKEKEVAKLRTRERKKFERWIGRYWGGMPGAYPCKYDSSINEYVGPHNLGWQVAWEVWQKFAGLPR